MPGKGKMTVTGNLRDVMKESIQAANAYVRSRAVDFGIEPPLFEKRDIHVHVPEGATPKDGPSAGVAMVTAIVSLMTGIPVKREVAMTGEITLRGRVLPIGGLKEKLLAALRAGIKTVIIPDENAKDLTEIPDELKNVLDIHPGLAHGGSAEDRLHAARLSRSRGRRTASRKLRSCRLRTRPRPASRLIERRQTALCRGFASISWSGSVHRVGPFLLIFRVFCASHTPLVCESERTQGLEGENPSRLGPERKDDDP